jgi:phosphonate transport system ATP-binding protein
LIELLGVGIRSSQGAWLVRGACAHFEAGELTFVVGSDPMSRLALLDIVAGRRVPTEGRAWVSGTPLMRETATAIASRVGEVHQHAPLRENRSVLWNVLPPGRWRGRVLRALFGTRSVVSEELALRTLHSVGLGASAHLPVAQLDNWRRRRISIARAMIPRPDQLIVREVDNELSLPQAADLLGVLRTLTRSERLPVLVSAAEPTLVWLFADRILVLSAGVLTFDGPPTAASGRAGPMWRELAQVG